MRSALADMLKAYDCRTADDYRHALNEIVQEIALLGLIAAVFSHMPRFTADGPARLLRPGSFFRRSGFFSNEKRQEI